MASAKTTPEPHNNPIVKVGDFIVVTEGRNSNHFMTDKVCKVIATSPNFLTAPGAPKKCPVSITVRILVGDDKSVNLFYSSPADSFRFADNEEILEAMREEINREEKALILLEKRLLIREKYASKEEYIANKIQGLFSDPQDRTAEILELLNELPHLDF